MKRLGELDAVSREFAQEHSERLWKQLVVGPTRGGEGGVSGKEALVAVGAGHRRGRGHQGARSCSA